jgi:DNA-binding response OmpR family regulator
VSKRILVIDDDATVRQAFSLTFGDSPYAVDTAESGMRALELAGERSYDLVFLDLRMPGNDGVQTLIELRRRGLTTPVFIVTAYHSEFASQLGELAKWDVKFELLSKPLGAQQLLAAAARAIRGRRR